MSLRPRDLVLGCLAGALTIAGLGLFVNVLGVLPMGTFQADYYYLPLREFVPEEKHRAMEERVIALYDAHARRIAMLGVVAFMSQLVLLSVVRRWGFTKSSAGHGEPSNAADSR